MLVVVDGIVAFIYCEAFLVAWEGYLYYGLVKGLRREDDLSVPIEAGRLVLKMCKLLVSSILDLVFRSSSVRSRLLSWEIKIVMLSSFCFIWAFSFFRVPISCLLFFWVLMNTIFFTFQSCNHKLLD